MDLGHSRPEVAERLFLGAMIATCIETRRGITVTLSQEDMIYIVGADCRVRYPENT